MAEENEEIIVSYAQNKEDILLSGFFPDVDKGFYVDIGASHPVVSSVTKLFYEKGWRGVNIEPNRKYFKLLTQDRAEDINVNVGISDKPGKLKFREYQGWGYSTFSPEIQKSYEDEPTIPLTKVYKDQEIKVKTLKEVLDEYHIGHIHFMKIDIEGFEYEALIGNDWSKYRPEVICIESNHMVKNWRPILAESGYKKAFFDGVNDYYVASESAKRIEYFSYTEAVLSSPVIPLRWHQEIGALRKRLQINQQSAESKQKELQRHINVLMAQVQYNNRIRHQMTSLAHGLDNALRIQIEKLNRTKIKRPNHKKAEQLSLPNTVDRQILLNTARLNDLDNFYSEHGSSIKRHKYIYKVTSMSYRSARTVSKAAVIKSYHLARSAKQRGHK